MKPKEWLLKNGHISEITRGRLSRENIAIIEEAVKNGVMIEGYSISTAPTPVKKSELKIEKSDPNAVYDVPNAYRDETVIEAYSYHNGNKVPVGMRTVCNICKCSLTHCPCQSPRVWVDSDMESMVQFTTRNTPITVRWF